VAKGLEGNRGKRRTEMTTGFIVGKFYPPHRGHKHLIDSARKQLDELIVMIAAHPSQKIPGELRQTWLREIHPDCDIRLVEDRLPNESKPWADFTVAYLGRAPDVVFTSEDYGPDFARIMGSRHVMIDRARHQVPISGTEIRKHPLRNLEYLEDCVRAWILPRVVLVGAESCGKTTLAKRLAEHFHTQWVAEYGREHWEKKVAGYTMVDALPSWSQDEFVHIAQEQQRREDLSARTAHPLLICDTNAFATGTWYERYYRDRHPAIDQMGERCKADLYLLAAPDVPFVQDGFRDGESVREWMHDRFQRQLIQRNARWTLLTGDYESRWPVAVSAVESLLKSYCID
jgi:HTH-type transcriptional regulator, transcriptional repressor of NAD biosynthesis genes